MDKLFVISIYDNEISITKPYGYNDLLKPSEVKAIIPYLTQYVKEHTDNEIEEKNFLHKQQIDADFKHISEIKRGHIRKTNGYVYLLKCADKFKIGYSEDVERRMKQLDTRPFPLELVVKVYSDIAYPIEQKIHEILVKHKLASEWYDFGFTVSAEQFEKFVFRIEKELSGGKV